ncbi:diguanylate cyclase (GGDEF) domain-containing protein [Oribacterium sp. KHPX15]|nr:diguanylate cyclase (GGDEF) domain-containing protein [Oribacterium sp. KHPX15]
MDYFIIRLFIFFSLPYRYVFSLCLFECMDIKNIQEVYIVDLLGVMLMIGVLASRYHGSSRNRCNRYLFWLSVVITISCITDTIVNSLGVYEITAYRFVAYIGYFWLYFSMMIIGPLWVLIIEQHINQNPSKLLKSLINYISLIGVAGLVINLFIPVIFIIDSSCKYYRGQYFWLYIGYALFFFFIGILVYVRGIRHSGFKTFFPVFQFFFPIIISLVLQLLFTEISIIWSGCAVSVVLMFINLQNENICIDKLTGLYNRYYLDRFSHCFEKLGSFCFMMMDINGFKHINDKYGHSEGDNALLMVADAVRTCVGSSGSVIRYSGDEFIILLNTSESVVADKCIEGINKNLENANKFSKHPYDVSVSIGYDFFDMKQIELDKLLEVIEGKMHEEKRKYYMAHDRRKNRVE